MAKEPGTGGSIPAGVPYRDAQGRWHDENGIEYGGPINPETGQMATQADIYGYNDIQQTFPTWLTPAQQAHFTQYRAQAAQEQIGYVPTFWEDPKRVARYYLGVKQGLPPGAQIPDWLNMPTLEAAFNYFGLQNKGKPWAQWDYPNVDDPARQTLQQLATPPADAIKPEEFHFLQDQMAQAQYTPSETVKEDLVYDIPKAQWDALPAWQKMVVPAMPWVGKLIAAGGGALMGAGVGGPVGAVAGAAAGAGLAYGAEKSKTLAKLMMKLDIPAETIERSLGMIEQVMNAATQPGDQYGTVAEILNNLGAAWNASHLFYETAAPKPLAGGPQTIQGWAGAWTVPENVQDIQGYSLAQARKALITGTATPEQVWQQIGGQFGFSGTLKDLVGHMFLDPLNLTGELINVSTRAGAKIAKNIPLEAAMSVERGSTLKALQLYGQKLRTMPAEEAATYGAMSKWIAGLDSAGNVIDYATTPNRTGVAGALDYLRGLTPASRATEVLGRSVDGIEQLINGQGGDPDTDVRLVRSLANAGPEGAVNAADVSPMPKWFASTEAQPIPLALRDALEAVDAHLEQWKVTRPNATILERTATSMGETTEKLVADLHNATPKQAQDTFRQFVDGVKARADAGDAEAAKIAKTLASTEMGKLDGIALKKMADGFVGEHAASLKYEQWRAELYGILGGKVDDWAARWFNVKPQGWVLQTGQVVKRAQGYLLLGLNPAYMINNSINNLVTLAWDGLLGKSTRSANRAWRQAMGIDPVTLKRGGIASEIGAAGGEQLGLAIHAAGRGTGTLANIDNFLARGRPLAVMANLSQGVERLSSEIAMTTAMREFMDKQWRLGRGFGKMPYELEAVLEAAQPGLAQKVYKAIQRGTSKASIEREIFTQLERKSIHDVLTPEDKQVLSAWPDLTQELEGKIKQAKTDEDVRLSIEDARTDLVQRMSDDVRRNIRGTVEQARLKAGIERQAGVIDTADNINQEYYRFWMQHLDNMDTVAEKAATMTGYARHAFYDAELRKADAYWRIQEDQTAAKWLGLVEGLGGDNITDAHAQAMSNLLAKHSNQQTFYNLRRDLMNEFYNFTESHADLTARDRSNKWAAVVKRENEAYNQMILTEEALQGQLDQGFATQYAGQFGDETGAQSWRSAIRTRRQEMAAAMATLRNGNTPDVIKQAWGSDIVPKEILARIKQLNGGEAHGLLNARERQESMKTFMTEIYQPYVRQLMDASNGNTPMLPTTPMPRAPAPARPELALAQPEGYVGPERRLTLTEERDLWAARHDQMTRLKNRYAFEGDKVSGRVGDFEAAKQVAVAAGKPAPVVAAADLRGLHLTNDNYSYAVGDAYIRSLAAAFRDEGIDAYRFGGDEFAAIFDTPEVATATMDRVMQRLENSIIQVGDKNYDGAKAHYGIAGDFSAAQGIGKHAAADWAASAGVAGRGYALREHKPGEPVAITAGRGAADISAQGMGAGEAQGVGETGTAAALAKYQAAVQTVGEFANIEGETRTARQARLDAWRQGVSDTLFKQAHPDAQGFTPASGTEFASVDDALTTAADLASKGEVFVKPETGEIITPEAIVQSADQHRTQVRQATHAIDPAVTADPHIVNIVRKYLGRNDIADINQVTPEMVTEAFAARAKASTLAKPTPREEVVQKAGEIRQAINEAEATTPPRSYGRGVVEDYLSNLLGNDKANDLMTACDVLAEEWAKSTGHRAGEYTRPEEWFDNFIAEHPDPTKAEMLDFLQKNEAHVTELSAQPAAPVPLPEEASLWKTPKGEPVHALAATEPTAIDPLIQATPAMAAPVGTADHLSDPPYQDMLLESYMQHVDPVFRKLEDGLTGQQATSAAGVFDINTLNKETIKALKVHLGKVNSQLTDTKLGAVHWGDTRRSMALLNYSRRTGFDNIAGMIMPYQFWYTRSMLNWAMRALDRPAILANYARLRQFMSGNTEGDGFPSRLKRKMGLYLPFLPDWMGEGVYIDPLRQIFPIEQLASPFDRLAEQKNQETKRAESNIQMMLENQDISQAEAQTALDGHKGVVWDRALAQAKNEIEANIQNPVDMVAAISGFSLPLQIAYKYLMGRQDELTQLPITRGVQAITARLGIGGPRGINLEGGIRKLAGLPEIDRFEDYRVDRELASLAATGEISARDAQVAMIDRSGPAFVKAQQQVSDLGLAQYLGAPLALDFFPEGEQEQRQLSKEYSRAIAAWKGGDNGALTRFFDKYPEYQARLDSFKEPADRLKRFMISEVWQRYHDMPAVWKEQTRQQLGDVFNQAFLNKDTRSYDSISTETLSTWAQMMGQPSSAKLPVAAGAPPATKLQLAEPKVAAAVTEYNAQKDKLFPNVGAISPFYYALPADQQKEYAKQYPQIMAYNRWHDQYLAAHPEVIPWVIGEKNELYGLPLEIQKVVYQYRAAKAQRFPDLGTLQDEYFAIPEGAMSSQYRPPTTPKGKPKQMTGRQAYLSAHPQLSQYWDWRKQAAAENPRAAPYILSEQSLSNAILPGYSTNTPTGQAALPQAQTPNVVAQVIDQFSPELTRQMMGYLYAKQKLSGGAMQELNRLWTEAGKPYNDIDKFIEAIKTQTLASNT